MCSRSGNGHSWCPFNYVIGKRLLGFGRSPSSDIHINQKIIGFSAFVMRQRLTTFVRMNFSPCLGLLLSFNLLLLFWWESTENVSHTTCSIKIADKLENILFSPKDNPVEGINPVNRFWIHTVSAQCSLGQCGERCDAMKTMATNTFPRRKGCWFNLKTKWEVIDADQIRMKILLCISERLALCSSCSTTARATPLLLVIIK